MEVRVKMDAHHNIQTTRRPRQSPRRQIKNGQRVAALRAFTAAKLHLRGEFPTIAIAAESCGANTTYVQAAMVLIRAGNQKVIGDVLSGYVPLLTAADELRRMVELVEAYRRARPQDLARAARLVGAEKLFSTMVEPAIDSTEELGLHA
jgi:uncharacterized protein YdbL (DUF1318 family)